MNENTSPKKLAANQRNAKKSTGPKTANGRAKSKMNAMKRGIYSKVTVVRGYNLKESQREYAALHLRFREELNPVGPVEEMLVDEIVTTQWRLQRALRAESGEIALSVDEGERRRNSLGNVAHLCTLWRLSDDPVSKMEDSVVGIHVLHNWLDEVKTAVEKDGELTEANIKNVFGERKNRLTSGLEKLLVKLQENPERLDATALRERNKQRALVHLNREL